jgi:hypothetical protein
VALHVTWLNAVEGFSSPVCLQSARDGRIESGEDFLVPLCDAHAVVGLEDVDNVEVWRGILANVRRLHN